MLSFLLLTACVEDVSKDKVEATVEEAPVEEPAVEKPQTPEAAGTAWAVDPAKSKLEALGAKITATHPIVFKDYSGQVTVDGDTVTGVSFTVQMATLEADHPKLTDHLKTEDFFDVASFPTAEFKSAAVKAGSETEGMTHTVSGDFTIRGQTKRITFPVKIEINGDDVHASTEFALNRQDFGVAYPGRPDDLVQDKVVLTVDFHAAKPAS